MHNEVPEVNKSRAADRVFWLFFALIILVFLASRIIPVIWFSGESPEQQKYIATSSDAASYDDYARWLAKATFADVVDTAKSYDEGKVRLPLLAISVFRMPLYPLLVSALFKVFGVKYLPVIIMNLVMAVLTLPAVILLAYQLTANRSAMLLAAGLFVFDPLGIFGSLALLSETLFTLLLVLSFYFLVLTCEKPSFPRAIILGLILGAACLTKTVGFYTSVIFLIVFFGCAGHTRLAGKGLPRGLFKSFAISLMIFLAMISIWSLRNYHVFGRFKLTCQVYSDLEPAKADYLKYALAHNGSLDGFFEKPHFYLTSKNPFIDAYPSYLRGKAYILSHKTEYLKLHLRTLPRLFFGSKFYVYNYMRPSELIYGKTGLNKRDDRVSRLFGLFRLFDYILLLGALIVVYFKKKREYQIFYFSVVAILFAFSIIYSANARGRYLAPMIPILCASSAAALILLIGQARKFVGKRLRNQGAQNAGR